MVQQVVFRKGEKSVTVHFMYNTDIIDVMRDHNGWWNRKDKAWQFPISKFQEVYDDIKQHHYATEIQKMEGQEKPVRKPRPQKTIDVWSNPDTVSVAGHCKECGLWHFLNKEGMCLMCTMNKDK